VAISPRRFSSPPFKFSGGDVASGDFAAASGDVATSPQKAISDKYDGINIFLKSFRGMGRLDRRSPPLPFAEIQGPQLRERALI